MMSDQLKTFQKKIGHEFNDVDFLNNALTHRSVSKKNNERLEFLGDAILSYIMAETLYEKFPSAKEGDLSRLRANLVKGVTLAKIAREYNVGDYLKLGAGELKSGGFNRSSILADTLEALIGAVYLDSDIKTCRRCVLSWYETYLADPEIFDRLKDAKTLLQEYMQARKKPLPDYTITKTEGEAHAQIFTITCAVSGIDYTTESTGTTRRDAEQKAAEEFLKWLEKNNE